MPEQNQFTLTYERMWNLGNYENEKISITRNFPDTVDTDAALKILFDQVGRGRQSLKAKPPTGQAEPKQSPIRGGGFG